MSSKKNRRDSFSFLDPRWAEAVPGLAAAVWTHKFAPWFSGPYERIDDLRLWVVREREGRPIMACFRPRVDRSVAVATVDRSTLVAAWDLSLRDGDGAIRPDADSQAYAVAGMFEGRWPRAAADRFPVPAAYVGYASRVRVRNTPEFAERLPEGASAADVSAAWDRVPVRYDPVGGKGRNHLNLYPAKFVSGDAHAPDVHPETLEPRPHPAVVSAPGWVLRNGGWAPAAPAGRGIMYVDVARIAGVEVENPAWQVYKEFGLLAADARRDDREAIDAAAARLADPREFTVKERNDLVPFIGKRAPRRVKFTNGDLLAALLNPHRPLTATTWPRVASFPVAALGEAEGRGWEFDLTGRGAAAAEAAAATEAVAAAS